MRFVIDENMSSVTAAMLRDAGHDVIAIAGVAPKLPDPEVMAWAVRESRILVTFDTDYGSLIYEHGFPPPPAVVLFRLANMPIAEIAEFVAHTLMTEMEWHGYFWVVRTGDIRRRPLPTE